MSVDLSVVMEKYAFLEGPRWHDGRLWLSDFFMGVVVSVDPPGEPRVEAEVPNGASGTGWLPDGRLLVVSMRDRRVLRREPDGTLVEHADLSHVATGWCNDMVVDRKGRAYVGNFGYDLMAGVQARPAPLVRVDPDGTTTVATQGLKFPNGSVVIGDVLVVGETNGNRLSAFDIAPDGALGPPRLGSVGSRARPCRARRHLRRRRRRDLGGRPSGQPRHPGARGRRDRAGGGGGHRRLRVRAGRRGPADPLPVRGARIP